MGEGREMSDLTVSIKIARKNTREATSRCSHSRDWSHDICSVSIHRVKAKQIYGSAWSTGVQYNLRGFASESDRERAQPETCDSVSTRCVRDGRLGHFEHKNRRVHRY